MSQAVAAGGKGLAEVIESYLAESEIPWEQGARDGEFVLTLPGEKKLKTVASLVAGESTLSVSAFVIRNPDENHEEFYRYLLRKNLRLPGLAYAIDASGDVYSSSACSSRRPTAISTSCSRSGSCPRCARSGPGASRGESPPATSRPSGTCSRTSEPALALAP